MSFFHDDKDPGRVYDVEAEEPTPADEGRKPEGEEPIPTGEPTEEEEAETIPHGEAPRSTATLATLSIVFSVIASCCCGIPMSVAALVLIIVDLRRRHVYDGLTVTALVCAILSMILSVVSAVYAALLLDVFGEAIKDGVGTTAVSFASFRIF